MFKNIFRKNQTRKLKVLQTRLQFSEQIEDDDDQYEISIEEEKKKFSSDS